jgi:hypothetical protein
MSEDEKLKLYTALQTYISESNALETLLKSTLKEKKASGSAHSSPEFGKDRNSDSITYDYQTLIKEIEKRKESLNMIQGMLGINTFNTQKEISKKQKRKVSEEEDTSTQANISCEQSQKNHEVKSPKKGSKTGRQTESPA